MFNKSILSLCLASAVLSLAACGGGSSGMNNNTSPTIKDPDSGTGGDNTGDDNTGDDNTGGDNTGGDNTGGDNTGGDNTGDDNTGDDNTGDDNTGGDNTGGDNTGGDNTGGDNTGDDNTGGDNTGGDNTGGDNTGGDNTGGDNTGGDNTGGDNTGDDNTGGDNTGGDNTGGDNTGGDNTGGDNTGGDNPGGDNTGGDNTGDINHLKTLTQTQVRELGSVNDGSYYHDKTDFTIKSDYKLKVGSSKPFDDIKADANAEVTADSNGNYDLDSLFAKDSVSEQPVKMVEEFIDTAGLAIEVRTNVYAYRQNYSIVGVKDVTGFKNGDTEQFDYCYYCVDVFMMGDKTSQDQLQAKIDGKTTANYKGKAIFASRTGGYNDVDKVRTGTLDYTMNFATLMGNGKLSGFDGIDDLVLADSSALDASTNQLTGDATRGEDEFTYNINFFGPEASEISGSARQQGYSDNEFYIFGGQEQE